mgnify:CR=1 FL=1
MAVAIPADFDFRLIPLDVNELYIRDVLGLKIEHWAKFRHAINIGNDASNLYSTGATLASDNVKSAYRELGKSHYEVVTSLGYAVMSLQIARGDNHLLMFQKSCKDFYFHAGCILDNLARLIFILNDRDSTNEIITRFNTFKRHWVGWGNLGDYAGHARAKRSQQLKGIRSIRNCLTHSWKIPFGVDTQGNYCWPLAVRLGEKSFLWPYDEIRFRGKYRKWIPIIKMMEADIMFLEEFQDTTFKKLIKDIKQFEQANLVEIR